jgi:inositol-phosphate phosphatase/L-galactose 1-phosphate phosphatase/histidinol-phosphatase
MSERHEHPCPAQYIDLAERIADAVAAIHLAHFRRDPVVHIKPDGTPVTDVDREAETRVREMIAARYPDHGVIGEEYPATLPEADYVWVVDPLDGTQLYIIGRPSFGLLLALAYRGRFILGVVDHAALNERWLGIDGHGSFFNGAEAHVRRCRDLSESILVRPGHRADREREDRAIDSLARETRWVQWGLAPHDYGLLASGHLDLIVSSGPKVYDIAPLDPLIRNAGGWVGDWQGDPLSLASSGSLIACGDPALAGKVVSRLRSGTTAE